MPDSSTSLTQAEAGTLRVIALGSRLTIDDVASGLGVSGEAARLRLDHLMDKGLVRRKKIGRPYLYSLSPERVPDILVALRTAFPQDRFAWKLLESFSTTVQQEVEQWASAYCDAGVLTRPRWWFDLGPVIHPAFTADQDLRITHWSPALVQLLGLVHRSPQQFLESGPKIFPLPGSPSETTLFGLLADGLSLYDWDSADVVPGITGREYVNNLQNQLLETGCVDKTLCRFEASDPTTPSRKHTRYLEFSMVIQKSFLGVQCIIPDVTPRVEAYQRNKSLTEAMFYLQHDVRHPASALAAGVASIRKQVETGRLDMPRETWAVLDKFCSRVESAADQLYDFADMFPLVDDLRAKEIPIFPLLNDLVGKARARIREAHGVSIETDFPPQNGSRFTVEGVPFLVLQALMNLLDNAVHHGSKPGDIVRLSGRVSDGWGTFLFADSGRGLPQDLDRRLKAVARLRSRWDHASPMTANSLGKRGGLDLSFGTVKALRGHVELRTTSSSHFEVEVRLPLTERVLH